MSQINNYIYCPYCATRLVRKVLFNQARPSCPQCGFVHFMDPKVAVIAFVTYRESLLLVRRAVDPGKGKWALPGGYMDAGEMPHGALQRELMEEVGLRIRVRRLLDIFPMQDFSEEILGARSHGIVLAYEAEPEADDLLTLESKDDVSAAGWFEVNDLPGELAFVSTVNLIDAWEARSGPFAQ